MKKAYIFDFDGTLADSMPSWAGKVLQVLKDTNTPYPPDLLKRVVTLGDQGAARYLREELGVRLSLEEIFRRMDDYALPRYRDQVQLKEGVYEYLKLLRSRGCTVHVLTASPHKMVDPCLKRVGIYDWFGHVWSCDDLGLTKSQPEIYHKAIAAIGLTVADGVFFDDSLLAVQTAVRAGLFTVGVFDPLAAEYTRQIRETADVYVDSFTQLMDMDI